MIYGHIFGGDIMEHFKRGVLLTLIGGTCWGFSGASGQFLFTHYQANPMWLTSMRMCFAGLLIIWCIDTKRSDETFSKSKERLD